VEKELIILLKKNDQGALKMLFERYHSSLCRLAATIVRDKESAKDIVQEVFIKLWRNRAQLEITSSWNAYLRRATVNTALNYLESHKRMIREDLDHPELARHSDASADKELAFDELKKKADHTIEKLPGRTRIVYTLIRSEEMSYREVAETLNISLKAVEKEMMKALKMLREALREYLPSAIILAVAEQFL
jgi:RNA polymerase sigma-70 factor, ECF subfamily